MHFISILVTSCLDDIGSDMRGKVILIGFCLLLQFEAIGQALRLITRDTVYYEEFVGTEEVRVLSKDTLDVKHGRYNFVSRLYNLPISNQLNRLKITGNYKEGKFEGLWTYKLDEYDLTVNDIVDGRTLRLDYGLDGIERNAKFLYSEGIPQGRWEIENVIVRNNRKQAASSGAAFQFDTGIAVGDFSSRGVISKTSSVGKLNEEGFFDGMVTIQYEEEGAEVTERRIYENGFLINLIKLQQDEVILDLEYEDVIKNLKSLEGTIENINFTISEEGFGLLFQNGYNEIDPKMTEQKSGNDVLQRVLDRIGRFANNAEDERVQPEFKLTRRFKFVYPDEEEDIILGLEPRLNIMLDEFNDFLSNPKFILNKFRIDSLPYIFGYIDHARKRSQDMLDVIELINGGFFDFLYRPNYYPNGLSGLNRPGEFSYESEKGEETAVFDLGVYVDNPMEIVRQMDEVSEILRKRTDKFLEYAFMEIRIFDQQATIDSLDNLIVQLKTKNDALYSYFQTIPGDRSFEEMPLDYRLYRVLSNNLLLDLQERYLDAEEFEEKVKLGEELTCLHALLEDKHDDILYFQNMPSRLDKTFTRFSPNPFFERDIETKILSSIYGKGTGVLFEYYLENLFLAKTCEQLKNRIQRIEKLEERLKELAEDSDNPEVGRLDRALRRENIPSRIERLLNL
jgi:hypothetical protein